MNDRYPFKIRNPYNVPIVDEYYRGFSIRNVIGYKENANGDVVDRWYTRKVGIDVEEYVFNYIGSVVTHLPTYKYSVKAMKKEIDEWHISRKKEYRLKMRDEFYAEQFESLLRQASKDVECGDRYVIRWLESMTYYDLCKIGEFEQAEKEGTIVI